MTETEIERFLERAHDLLDQAHEEADALGQAHEILQRLGREVERARPRAAPELRGEVHLALAETWFLGGDPAACLAALDRAAAAVPEDSWMALLRVQALFHGWRHEEIAASLPLALEDDSTRAEATYYQGLLAEFEGRCDEGDRLQREAIQQGAPYEIPCRVTTEEAEQILARLLQSLPADIQVGLEDVSIALLPLPEPRPHGTAGLDPLILGYQSGPPLTMLTESVHFDVARIELFQRNIERIAADREEVIRQLRITLLHEIGHHLGWDEEEVERRGLA